MKLHIDSQKLSETINASLYGLTLFHAIESVSYDTRKIQNPEQSVFFALEGQFRDGHDFISAAYLLGVRCFVISKKVDFKVFPDAQFLLVENSLIALQKLAASHRSQFSYPVVGITGSVGKTIVKEWIYHCISEQMTVVRSPKSYNSQLGVALSLLEMNESHQIALIEAGISQPNEMQMLQLMIQPTIGIFTSLGSAHEQNFSSKEQQLSEKMLLFNSCKNILVEEHIPLKDSKAIFVKTDDYNSFLAFSPFQDKASLQNLAMVLALIKELGIDLHTIESKIKTLPRLALRMETFEGINQNTIINDTYNADLDALTQSLEYQLSLAGGKNRSVIIGVDGLSENQIEAIKQKIESFHLYQCFFIRENEIPPTEQLQNQVILIKGTRAAAIQRIAGLFRLKRHKTRIEINLTAVKKNLSFWRSQLNEKTKLLVMVKASSYGSGAEKMAEFLEKDGIDYLGVAYVDEGIELRKYGIKLPILVMNVSDDSFDDLIRYNLEPTLFNFEMMDLFVQNLIEQGKENYPVHLKFDTGMRRLGFETHDVAKVLEFIQAQPEIKVQSIYSHLAESDNLESTIFTQQQISIFKKICTPFENQLPYHFMKHLLNSEGITRFPEAQFDMVRIGIGLYGISVNPAIKQQLSPAISWKSIVSQIKTVKAGESVGYSRSYIAPTDRQIAIIPVGYADGFRRNLSQGKGGMIVNGNYCSVLGNVCMDMTMLDISGLDVKQGDEVEIIGSHQSIENLAQKTGTISYEILTSLSRRVERIYIEE